MVEVSPGSGDPVWRSRQDVEMSSDHEISEQIRIGDQVDIQIERSYSEEAQK